VDRAGVEGVVKTLDDAAGRFIPSITVGPITRKPPTGVTFGTRYGSPWRAGSRVVWMFRKGQRVRFFTAAGVEVGEEQRNVAPAVAYMNAQGWTPWIDARSTK
jgi:hypothetical protein